MTIPAFVVLVLSFVGICLGIAIYQTDPEIKKKSKTALRRRLAIAEGAERDFRDMVQLREREIRELRDVISRQRDGLDKLNYELRLMTAAQNLAAQNLAAQPPKLFVNLKVRNLAYPDPQHTPEEIVEMFRRRK